jgi:hypothetical protein
MSRFDAGMPPEPSQPRTRRSVRASLVLFTVVALAVAGGILPVTAANAATIPSSVSQSVPASVVRAVHPTRVIAPKQFNAYGCVSLIGGARNVYVAAFALGYCPSVVVFQTTSWGRAFINWIDNGVCRVPWLVSAITGGRISTC